MNMRSVSLINAGFTVIGLALFIFPGVPTIEHLGNLFVWITFLLILLVWRLIGWKTVDGKPVLRWKQQQ